MQGGVLLEGTSLCAIAGVPREAQEWHDDTTGVRKGLQHPGVSMGYLQSRGALERKRSNDTCNRTDYCIGKQTCGTFGESREGYSIGALHFWGTSLERLSRLVHPTKPTCCPLNVHDPSVSLYDGYGRLSMRLRESISCCAEPLLHFGEGHDSSTALLPLWVVAVRFVYVPIESSHRFKSQRGRRGYGSQRTVCSRSRGQSLKVLRYEVCLSVYYERNRQRRHKGSYLARSRKRLINSSRVTPPEDAQPHQHRSLLRVYTSTPTLRAPPQPTKACCCQLCITRSVMLHNTGRKYTRV